MTPHIEAKEFEIAKKVIMPGDPLRAKHIAEKHLINYIFKKSLSQTLFLFLRCYTK